MRIKLTLIRGIVGMAMSASVFLGCQDFLSEDKAAQTAKSPTEENVLAASSQDDAGAAKDLPATAVDTLATAIIEPSPATPEPASTPAATDNLAECKDIYAQMQTVKDPLYGELKNKFGSLNCDLSKVGALVTPFVPPDSATVCKNLKATLAILDPGSPKYPYYQQDIATYCTANP